MTKPNIVETVVQHYKRLIMKQFVTCKIVSGGTKKAREYSHLFIHGNFYGGKLGTMLCRKGFKQWQLFGAAETILDLCPQCKARLSNMAKILANQRTKEIYAVAGGDMPESLTRKEILDLLIALREYEKPKPVVKQEQTTMFDAEEVKQPVRKTEPWKVRQPQSTLGNTDPST